MPMPVTRPLFPLAACLLAVLVSVRGAVPPDHAARMQAGTALFEKTVGPAFKEHCLSCHGGEKTRGGLDLSSRESLLKGGESGSAIDLQTPENSLLLKLLRHEEKPFMPAKKPALPAPLIADLGRWISQGAPYNAPLTDGQAAAHQPMRVTDQDRTFWAFRPLTITEAPPGQGEWKDSPIDRFILAALTAKAIQPNPPADPRTLARRASLDLTGLPPSPDALDRFLSAPTPPAWSDYVDHLLASPQYGERQARHWMDVARFAESSGFEHDYDRPTAYHYRDFLIKAFNEDLPWDRFTSWQIAGDELAPEEPLAQMATGFLAAGAFPTQLTEAEFERARYDELDDMAATTGAAFLGLSVGCARCHDHKYDPIPSADYYRFVACFATAIRSEKDIAFHPDDYQKKLGPWQKRHLELEEGLRSYEASSIDPGFTAWLEHPGELAPPDRGRWSLLEPESVTSTSGTVLTRQPDGSWLATGNVPVNEEYVVRSKVAAGGAAVRLEALTHPTLPHQGPGRAGNGNFALGDISVQALLPGSSEPQAIKLTVARATHEQNQGSLSVKSSIDGDREKSGWAVDAGGIGKDQAAVFVFEKPLTAPAILTFRMRFHLNGQHSLGRFRLAVASDPATDFEVGRGTAQNLAEGMAALKKGRAALSSPQQEALRDWYAHQDAGWQKLQAAVQEHLAIKPAPDVKPVLICSEGVKPLKHHADGRGYPHFYPEVHTLRRGDPKQSDGVAKAGFLQVLMPAGSEADQWRREPPAGATTSYRRASLAAWMTDVEKGAGQLLARVMVNRVWQHHFGRGLVATPNDFGFQGERPTHPELLDWLANDLITHGWSLKRLHKTILMSATYRQSGDFDAADAAKDPENQLLWRFAPRRLEGEAIRDSLLAVSGLLDPTMFGPGSLDENMRRRSVYFTVKRSRLPNSMLVFDWPEHLVSIGARPVTTVAPQSLYLMNSPQSRQYADALAKRSGGAIPTLYLLALGREVTPAEQAGAEAFLKQQSTHYQKQSDAAHRALTDFCQALLSSNEFLYLP